MLAAVYAVFAESDFSLNCLCLSEVLMTADFCDCDSKLTVVK